MATEIGNNETEVLTQAMAGPEETFPRPEPSGQDGETPPIRDHQVAEGPAPRRVHTRNRKARAFTMSDEVHALLGTIAERNGVTMSAYIETLILTADDLSIDPQAQDLLGVMANKAARPVARWWKCWCARRKRSCPGIQTSMTESERWQPSTA